MFLQLSRWQWVQCPCEFAAQKVTFLFEGDASCLGFQVYGSGEVKGEQFVLFGWQVLHISHTLSAVCKTVECN